MRILVIYQHYLGEGEPGGLRYNEFGRLWTAAGHDVTVISGTLNYATGKQRPETAGRLITRSHDDAVTVLRAHVPSSYATGKLGRMWAFGGFTVSSSLAVWLARRPDVVIASSPPLVAGVPGWIAARLRRPGSRIPLVVEIRDLWPESAITTGVLRADGVMARLLYGLEAWTCRVATKINVLTPAFRDDLLARNLARADDIWFIPNGADTDLYVPADRDNEMRRQLGWGDRFVALYAGAHGRANALHQLIDAARHLRARRDILIACVGDGPLRGQLAEQAGRERLDNIVFHGPFAKKEMPRLVAASDLGVAVLQDNPTFRTVYPNKVFDTMSCARPVLLAIDGAIRELVCERADAGIYAPAENGPAIAAAVQTIADDPATARRMGENGRRWVVANASRDALAARYLDALTNLVNSRGPIRRTDNDRLAS